jgi:putative transposase
MPRRARLLLEGFPHHIIQRGHNRQQCFHADGDYHVYLDSLGKYCGQMRVSLHAYVLMTNHVHLLASFACISSVAEFMKAVGQKHTQYINNRLKRSGTIWEGRYWSCPVPTDRYFMICQRYVELNPVRAGMVETPGSYPWSSFQVNAGEREILLLQPHDVYVALSHTPELRHQHYRSLFEQPLSDADVMEIRRATLRNELPGTPAKPTGRPKKKPGTDPGF